MDGNTKLGRTLGPQRQHSLKIWSVNKNTLAVVTPLNDVVWITGQGQSGKAGHSAQCQSESRWAVFQ
jgi:hypothetical protein